ncbi:helix-turn-helix domain-containing protein [Streptomyces sp. NPDC054932]
MAGGEAREPSPGQRLGSALKALQQGSGRTLRSLESEVMISDSSLSRYLRGSTVPPWATVRDLCRALEADPSDYRLLWEEADRSQPKPLPAVPVAVTDTATGPSSSESGWRRWRTAAGLRVRSRWASAGAAACAGMLLGTALTWFALVPDASSPAARSDSDARSGERESLPSVPGTQDTVRIFVNRSTGNCLDHSLDHGVRSYLPNGMSYQRWTVHPLPDGTAEMRNHATGACLDGGPAGLRALSCGKADSQRWALTAWADHSVQVKNASTGTCLDDGASGLRAVPCDRSEHQKWG